MWGRDYNNAVISVGSALRGKRENTLHPVQDTLHPVHAFFFGDAHPVHKNENWDTQDTQLFRFGIRTSGKTATLTQRVSGTRVTRRCWIVHTTRRGGGGDPRPESRTESLELVDAQLTAGTQIRRTQLSGRVVSGRSSRGQVDNRGQNTIGVVGVRG